MKSLKTLFGTAALFAATCALSLTANAFETKEAYATKGGQKIEIQALPSGLTLYTFDIDSAGASSCKGDCAEKWPPVLLSAAEAQTLKAPFGTIKRANGLLQLTIGNQPLYTFYLDRVEGDILGDDVGSVWHIVPIKD